MNSDDVLDQAAQGQVLWIHGHTATSVGFRISQLFEDLVYRELQFLARPFER